MSLTKNEILNFSEFCKKNNYFISIEQLKVFFEYKSLKNLKNFEKELLYLYFLIPKSRQDQILFKNLINQYFKYSIVTHDSSDYSLLEEYIKEDSDLYEIFSDLNNGDYESLNRLVRHTIENFGDIDFTRPVSDQYWLNQIKKSLKYQEIMGVFNSYQFDDLSKITNLINKDKFNNLLDLKILEILNEERNKTKDSYQPSELEPKTQLGELDFLYTDQEERRLLLEQTHQLGNKLAIKFKDILNNQARESYILEKQLENLCKQVDFFKK